MTAITRRDFIKYAGMAGAVIVVGSKLGWMLKGAPTYAAVATLDFTITDAMKEMHTHNTLNDARCYFWVYKSNTPNLAAECPGPTIVAARGDTINISVTNGLDEAHTLSCPTLGVTSAPIAPGATAVISIPASIPGAHLYYDHLNAPVNRMMGLHGAIIVMPTEADRLAGHNLTPYSNSANQLAADHAITRLYDDFGRNTQTGDLSDCFPGLAWEQGDNTPWALNNAFPEMGTLNRPNCPPFRQYVWLLHQASPKLFAEVGNAAPGTGARIPANFMNAFLRDPFQPHAFHTDNPGGNRLPQYFTINGQSGFFSHFNPTITPMGRVGEPVVIHIMNAGLWTHSMHLHANHMWVSSVNGTVNPNPIWVDVFRVDPMNRVDYTVPFMRPPSIPNDRGIGMPDNPRNGGLAPHPVWPPVEEMNVYIPALGTKAKNSAGQDVELGQRLSPLCYPMHDHSEPSQTSQGGNYNTGLISGIYFTGDRNTAGHLDFPMDEDFWLGYQNIRGVAVTQPAAPPMGM